MTISLAVGLILFASLADDPPRPPDKPDTVPQDKPAAKKSDAERPAKPADLELLKSLEKQSAPSEPDTSPLERVDQRMRDVQGRLSKADAGDETQIIQKSIVDDLDMLIAQIKKGGGCPTCGAAQCNKHGKKRETSQAQSGKPGKPDKASEPNENDTNAQPGDVSDEQRAAASRVVRAVWGHLPEKLREEMQQASQDTGLPKYRSLIELYFRAIAEQNEPRRSVTP